MKWGKYAISFRSVEMAHDQLAISPQIFRGFKAGTQTVRKDLFTETFLLKTKCSVISLDFFWFRHAYIRIYTCSPKEMFSDWFGEFMEVVFGLFRVFSVLAHKHKCNLQRNFDRCYISLSFFKKHFHIHYAGQNLGSHFTGLSVAT